MSSIPQLAWPRVLSKSNLQMHRFSILHCLGFTLLINAWTRQGKSLHDLWYGDDDITHTLCFHKIHLCENSLGKYFSTEDTKRGHFSQSLCSFPFPLSKKKAVKEEMDMEYFRFENIENIAFGKHHRPWFSLSSSFTAKIHSKKETKQL